MAAPTRNPSTAPLFAAVITVAVAGWLSLAIWLGGVLTLKTVGISGPAGTVRDWWAAVLDNPTNPAAKWELSHQPGFLYWTFVGALFVGVPTLVLWLARRPIKGWSRNHWVRQKAGRSGMATAAEITKVAGARQLLERADVLRPSLKYQPGKPVPGDVGLDWGRARGVRVWTSVRDSCVLVGPSGSGKTAYVVINKILSAPGAVIVTSVRPDVLTPTMRARQKIGPVSVLAADGSVGGIGSDVAWSPIRGCEDAETATVRAHAMVAESGAGKGVQDASYWAAQAEGVIKRLLHAAALAGRGIDELWAWAQNPAVARGAANILSTHPRAEYRWAEGLIEVLDAHEQRRGNIWSQVQTAFGGLDSSSVRARFNPAPGNAFDPVAFLRGRGTLFLMAKEKDPAGPLLAAMIADVVRVAGQISVGSPEARLDPPLLLMLDEIANFATLPDLDVWVSGLGGSGIVTIAVFQSLIQAADRWGREKAEAIWNAATIRVVLGGVGSTDELRNLAGLTGQRDEATWTPAGQGGRSSSVRQVPVLSEAEIRGMPQGVALMLVKSCPPMLTTMTAYWQRPDGRELSEAKHVTEEAIIGYQRTRMPHLHRFPPAPAAVLAPVAGPAEPVTPWRGDDEKA